MKDQLYTSDGKPHKVNDKAVSGLRFCGVKGQPGLVIDQYGRVFENGPDELKCVGVGYATH